MVNHAVTQPRWELLASGISATCGKQIMDTCDESQDAASRRPLHSIMTICDSLLGYARYGWKSTAQSLLARSWSRVLRGDLNPGSTRSDHSFSLCTYLAGKHYC